MRGRVKALFDNAESLLRVREAAVHGRTAEVVCRQNGCRAGQNALYDGLIPNAADGLLDAVTPPGRR
jgi:hypothetical protein